MNHMTSVCICIVNSGSWDVDDIGFEEFYMGLFLIAEELTSLEDTQLHGIVLIVDHKNLSMNSIRKAAGQMSLTNIKRIVNLFQVRNRIIYDV